MFGAKTPFGGGGFGSTTSAFGAQSTPFGGATSGGLFGSKTPASNTFGTPTFGSTTPAPGGLFGNTTGGPSLFGAKTTQPSTGFGGFGATSSGGGLFGGGGSSLFQAPQTSSAFGAKPATSAFGGFGSTSTANPFGGTSTSTGGGLFGGTTSAFGAATTSGTTVKFNPVKSTEQMVKSGITLSVKTQNQCITVMDQYKNKSVEELRMEDYAANRKGGSTAATGFGAASTGGGLFGAKSSGTSLFGNPAASKSTGFGGFGTSTATSGGLFGQTSTNLFGAKTTPSLFGATTTTTASGFGGFGATTSTGGLFGAQSSAPSLFGNTASSGFGTTATTGGLFGGTTAFGQPASSGTGLFGNTAKPAFGFGASSGTPAFGTSSTLTSGGGLFGSTAAKPAFGGFGTTGGFGGTTSSSGNLFGGTSTAGGGLFGAKPTGFGTTGFGTSTAGTTLFGTNTLGAGTVGFGTGAQNNNAATLGGLTNIDQTTLAALRQQQIIQQQMKAIANTPFGDSPLFRNITEPSKEKPTTQSSTIKEPLASSQYKVLSRPAARIKPLPISSPSMGKSRLFDDYNEEHDFSPRPLVPRKSVKKLIIKKKSSSSCRSYCDMQHYSSTKPYLMEDIGCTVENIGRTIVRLIIIEELEPRFYDTQLKLRTADGDDLLAPSPDIIKSKDLPLNGSSFMSPATTHQPFDNTISELQETTPLPKKRVGYVITPSSPVLVESPDLTYVKHVASDEVPPSKIVLSRDEYYTKPSMDELNARTQDGECIVRDFVVGREGYGEVKFLGSTNVYGINLDNIVFFRRREVEVYPDDYKDKPEVGNELNKPAEITLLKVWPNDKSSQTPVKTPERLKASGFIDRIEEKTLAMDALFLDYRPKEGAWVFKVNHFTRYGMQEQFIAEDQLDEEIRKKKLLDENEIHFEKEKIISLVKEQANERFPRKNDSSFTPASLLTPTQQIQETDEEMTQDESEEYTQTSQDEETIDDESTTADESYMPFSYQMSHVAQLKPFNLQAMKNSVMYEEEEEVYTPNTLQKRNALFSNKSIFGSTFMAGNINKSFQKLDLSQQQNTPQNTLNNSVFLNLTADRLMESDRKVAKKMHLFKPGVVKNKDLLNENSIVESIEPAEKAAILIKCQPHGLAPYHESLLFGHTAMLADASLTRSRDFHVRWMNTGKLVHTGDSMGVPTHNTVKQGLFTGQFSQSSPYGLTNLLINIEQLQTDTKQGELQYIEECLNVALEQSDFEEGEGLLPKAKLSSPFNIIQEYVQKSHQYNQAANSDEFKVHCNVWALVQALWGTQELDDEPSLYEIHSARRNALSKWLSFAVNEQVKREVNDNKVKDEGHLSVIFSHLSGNQLREACKVARDNKEIRLAFLLSQLAGDCHLKHHLRNQLAQWEERNVDCYINEDRLKLYILLSGMMVWKSTNTFVNLCQDLDWRRCLALHLWYYCSSTATCYDAFTEYQNSFKGTETYEAYSAFPHPEYSEKDGQTKDVCYHLLALYCKKEHSLEKLLTPHTHTKNPLDYHLSWHVHRVLEELGYTHLHEEKHTLMLTSYAQHLENLGLWHWSVFVMMHLNDRPTRESSVKELLSRFCRVTEDDKFTVEEQTIVNKFHVPQQWIHQAKAQHARYSGRHYEEAVHSIRAGFWAHAHEVILQHLAADAIIDEDYEDLKNLLTDISSPERCCVVKDWKLGGQIFLDYILLNEKLESLKSNETNMTSYHLEDLESEIASILNRINLMKITSSRERLCQSEMAKSCSSMLKVVFAQLNTQGEGDVDEDSPKWRTLKVAPYVVDLPLPSDYYLRELRELLNNFTQECDQNAGE